MRESPHSTRSAPPLKADDQCEYAFFLPRFFANYAERGEGKYARCMHQYYLQILLFL